MSARSLRLGLAVPLGVLALALWLAATKVDLRPRVENDFFFASDDPALSASREIAERFATESPVLVGIRTPEPLSAAHLERLEHLSDELAALPTVGRVLSHTSGPGSPQEVATSPLWSRLLQGEDEALVYLLMEWSSAENTTPAPRTTGPAEPWSQLDAVLARHSAADFELFVSGVPWVVEQIRRALERDLRVFSGVALLLFGLAIGWIYRAPRLVLGMLSTCVTASLLTLLALSWFAVPIGLLTANIVTIAFVLTLSHTVFLTNNWRRLLRVDSPQDRALRPVAQAIRVTAAASFWSMVTTLLGFATLRLAPAKPLRELAVAGLCATLFAAACAYLLYPFFLASRRPPTRSETATRAPRWAESDPRSVRPLPWLAGALVCCIVAGPGLGRLDTDPSLLSYFDDATTLYRGLEIIDADRGSSPLHLVVSSPDGSALDEPENGRKLRALQSELEEDPTVGTTLSIVVLAEEAQQNPLARLLGWKRLVQLLERDQFVDTTRGFLSPDHRTALYSLSMHEADRQAPRSRVIARLAARVDANGLQATTIGGLYDLQSRLGQLIREGLVRQLGALLGLFLVVAYAVSRRVQTTLAMVLCVAAIPCLLLGALGLTRVALDIISSPAVNVAIAIGIDSMIHLAAAARRQRSTHPLDSTAWTRALAEQGPAVLAAAAIVAAGFAIFLLSSFPPTRRFGGLVGVGMVLAAIASLRLVPVLATLRGARRPEPRKG